MPRLILYAAVVIITLLILDWLAARYSQNVLLTGPRAPLPEPEASRAGRSSAATRRRVTDAMQARGSLSSQS